MRGNTCTLWWICTKKIELKLGRSFGILSNPEAERSLIHSPWVLPVLSSTPSLPSSTRLRASYLQGCASLHSTQLSLEITVDLGTCPRPWALCTITWHSDVQMHYPTDRFSHSGKVQGLACCMIQKKPTFGQVFFKTMALFPSLSAFLKRKTRNKAFKHFIFLLLKYYISFIYLYVVNFPRI